MIAESLVLIGLPVLLAVAAGWDLASFTIPNFVQGALIAGFVIFVVAVHLSPVALAWHLLAGFLGLAIGFTLFALGYIGGGDAKLFAAIILWLGFRDFLPYAVIASILGGALTMALLGLRMLPLPAICARRPWILALHHEKSGIPYGVALAAGVFVILPQTEIFRIAAGA